MLINKNYDQALFPQVLKPLIVHFIDYSAMGLGLSDHNQAFGSFCVLVVDYISVHQ